MTDNEINNALEWCEQFENNIVFKGSGDEKCVQALQMMVVIKHALRNYERQQAETARLNDKAERATNAYFIKEEQRRNAKAEAVKEISCKAVLCKDCANAWTTICGKRYCSRLYAAVSDDDFCSLGTKTDKQKA